MVHFELPPHYDTVCVRTVADKKGADVSREVPALCRPHSVSMLFESTSVLTVILFLSHARSLINTH